MATRWYLPGWGSTILAWGLLAGTGSGGDWPQILGPQRNGQAFDEQLADHWPTDPIVAWRHPVGEGYAGPAVVGQRVFIFHRLKGDERLEALELETGQPIWRIDFPTRYRGGIDPDTGPRCVPLVHQDRVVVFGAAGVAHAVAVGNGQLLWTRDLYDDFGGQEGYFGAGSTPIVVGSNVLFNTGGKPQAGLVALSLQNGQTVWQGSDEGASYASPTQLGLTGQMRVVFVTRLNVLVVNPADGAVLLRLPFGKRGPTVNAATPLVWDDRLFLTASYGVGARLLAVDDRGARPIWSNDDTLSSQYNTPLLHEGFLYGIHGREDVGRAELRCVEAATGKVVWSRPDFGVAHLLLGRRKTAAAEVRRHS